MPSMDMLMYFQQHLTVESLSYVNGVHYSRTLEQWLVQQDRTEKQLMPLFKVPCFSWLAIALNCSRCCWAVVDNS